ncbi:hypothetical protein CPB84DRAFT_1962343 [Gymnopilus junonius]|uniref:Uncharacterized protein n=1 Tax=Gymnopilus junonius TaxID=109634 RepID=A0A9P5NQP2_GYMJU|nr:hypothetical protein CPB84DRAFT_1962343 [Gymnopilus junonius]
MEFLNIHSSLWAEAWKRCRFIDKLTQKTRPNIPQATDFEHHAYPFRSLPKIKSHIHPRFVLCHTAQKYALEDNTFEDSYKTELRVIVQIYKRWVKPVPPQTLDNKQEAKDPDDNREDKRSEVSYRTRSGRWNADTEDDDLQEGDRPSKRARSEAKEDADSINPDTLVDIIQACGSITTEEKESRIINWVADVAENTNCLVQSKQGIPAFVDFQAFASFGTLFYGISAVWYYLLGVSYVDKEHSFAIVDKEVN